METFRKRVIRFYAAVCNIISQFHCFPTTVHTVYDTGLKKPNKRIDQLDKILEKQPYLAGENFTLADVAVASYLLYVLQFFPGVDVSRWPHVKAYMKDCCSREAYGKAFGDKVQNFLLSQLGSEAAPKKMFGVFWNMVGTCLQKFL